MATEEMRRQSDIDLLVVTEGNYRKKRVVLDHVPVDVTYGPLKNVERRLEGRLINCVTVLREGHIIYDRDGCLKRLKRQAEEIYKAGPEALTRKEIDLTRFRLSEVLKDIEETRDPAVAVQMMNIFFEDCLSFYFSFRRRWQPKRKKILRRLAEDDPYLNSLCRKYLLTSKVGDKRKLIRRIAEHVLRPAGGILEEIDIELVSPCHQGRHECQL